MHSFRAAGEQRGSAADASGRRRQEVRRRAARRRNRTSDDVDVALDFATRCEVLVWVDARRNLLFPRPLLKLLVLLALHDCEGRKRRRGLAHRAHAASAHHQRIGCRCQARNDEEARRRHAPEARTLKFRRGGRSGQYRTWSTIHARRMWQSGTKVPGTDTGSYVAMGSPRVDSPTAACPACHDHAYMPEPCSCSFRLPRPCDFTPEARR